MSGTKYPCDRFAAFLAHCLNSEESPSVQVNAGALYDQLTQALAARYAVPLLHHHGYARRMSPEEAALRYFETSLARRLLLSGRVELSVSHRLFEVLCRRATEEGWDTAILRRGFEKVVATEELQQSPHQANTRVATCAQQLSSLSADLSPGSASATIRERSGAIVLQLETLGLRVPEELSTWDAIVCAPQKLHALPEGEAFNLFCSVVIDCIRTAHRPFQELLGLGRGLCPFDWEPVLSVQQTRALRKFLTVLQDLQIDDTPANWERAWTLAPVPGFKTSVKLWQSEIGLALRQSLTDPEAVDNPHTEFAEEVSDEAELLREREFIEQLELMARNGVINSVERLVLEQLYQGVSIAAVVKLSEVRFELRRTAVTFEALMQLLQYKVKQWHDRQVSESLS